MSIIEAIILGIVQGITEFVPVSSSGHLVLFQEALGVTANAGLTFDVALHVGTLLALFIYFAKDIRHLALGLLGKNDSTKLAWLLALATIPAAVGGVLLKDAAESTFRSPALVSMNLILVALLMLWAEMVAKRRRESTDLEHTSIKQAMIVGFAQVLALIPGTSRSGSTIVAGMFAGLGRVAATRFSFLLAIPITLGAVIKVALDANMATVSSEADVFITGIVVALLSGLLAIKFLMNYLSKRSLAVFAYYRIVLGVGVLLFLAIR